MPFKIIKTESDGRIHTFGVRLIDGEMLVTDDPLLAKQFEDFGYHVAKTTLKNGTYPASKFGNKK